MSEFHYFMDTQRLRIAVSNMRNANSSDELERIKTQVLQNLSRMPPAPSVHFHDAPAKQVRGLACKPHEAVLLRIRVPHEHTPTSCMQLPTSCPQAAHKLPTSCPNNPI